MTEGFPVLSIPSSHHAPRTAGVDLLVLHAMGEWVIAEGVYHHCTDFLRHLGLSAHAFCLPDGRIIESVDPSRKAFHAGRYNARSIGMEIVVAGGHDLASLERCMAMSRESRYTAVQYQAAGWWFRRRADEQGLSLKAVRTHAELDPTRKQDPGRAFDMGAFRAAFMTSGG